ncbi:MAG: ferric reductase-like transmembrane domain-containing protein [Micrococcales bacterium]|nr:ferric reductase-like transmembrane domain-containing protein [Micrococcales bacterium]
MIKGAAVIGGAFGLTVLFWALSSPPDGVAVSVQVSQLFGGLALTGFAALFALATRIGVLDLLFDGLDKSYVAHKWLGIATVGLVVVHLLTQVEPGRGRSGGPGSPSSLGEGAGPDRWALASLVTFVVLALVALLAKKMSHEAWKTVHKLMAVAYAFGLVHYYGASLYGPWGTSPYSLWLNLVNLLGVAAAVYSVLLYERLAFRYPYQVTGLRQVGTNNLEVTAASTGRALTWRPGQFTFVKILRLAFPSHPFTIAQAPDGRTVQLAIRALGDHTSSLAGSLKIGDRLLTSAAHGRFDYTTGLPRQVWIAAGIGITPFRSFLQAGVPSRYSVDFFYSFDAEHGAYLDELTVLAGDVRLHLVDTSQTGFLTAQQIAQTVTPGEPVDVYFCGPQPMRDALRQGLRKSPLDVRRFHYEEFQFGR